MGTTDAVVISLGCAILLSLFARRLAIPYPSILVLGGLAVAMIPGLPLLAIQPSITLSIFLPVVLFEEASHVAWRNLRSRALTIALFGPALVIASCAAVAGTTMLLFPGIPVAVAIVIGAIIAPADSVASGAVLERLRVSHKIEAMLAGESLTTDSVAVVIYKVAVGAALGSVVSAPAALGELARLAVGGILFGIAAGWAGASLMKAAREPMIYSLMRLFLAYGVYIGADAIGVSGALATVSAGLAINRLAADIPAELRITASVVSEVAIFGLNAFGFLLIGAQLPTVLADLSFYTPGELAAYAAAICTAVILVRLIGVSGFGAIRRLLAHSRSDAALAWRDDVIVGWSGMRGLVSLAAALGLPPTPEGSVFPYRDLAVFLAFAVILATLVGQGLSLAGIVRWLGAPHDDRRSEAQTARIAAAEAVLARLETLCAAGDISTAQLEGLRHEYLGRLDHLRTPPPETASGTENRTGDLRLILIEVERRTIMELKHSNSADGDVVRELLSELDAAEFALRRRGSTNHQANGHPD